MLNKQMLLKAIIYVPTDYRWPNLSKITYVYALILPMDISFDNYRRTDLSIMA